jgi:uroporphyrinogen-III decarboxylase
MKRNYGQVFVLLVQINKSGVELTKEEAVSIFTNGDTTSLTALSDAQLEDFKKSLQLMVPKPDFINDKLNQTRRAIISQFKAIGRTTADAIAWAEKYGVFGNKRKFNEYDGQELWQLLQNAKNVKADTIKSVTKQ